LQVVGGSEHTLRAKLTFTQELHGALLVNNYFLAHCFKRRCSSL